MGKKKIYRVAVNHLKPGDVICGFGMVKHITPKGKSYVAVTFRDDQPGFYKGHTRRWWYNALWNIYPAL